MGSNPTLSATIPVVAQAIRFAAWLVLWTLAAALAALTAPAMAQQALAPEIEAFIEEMVSKHQFEAGALRRLFARTAPRPDVISAISAPATARPWHEFRGRFVNAARINGGVRFWREHAATLERASREFGVPAEIIVATIGVETLYGRNTGTFQVLEALTTLAFNYPPRAKRFRSELEEFLLLQRETGLDVMRTRGSYAGAIGIPQFLPSSYRRYAVDFDGDGRRDLLRTTADAIGSVANYYRSHGWRAGEPVTVVAEPGSGGAEVLAEVGVRPQFTAGELKRLGVVPAEPVAEGADVALITAESATGPVYWLGFNNFYVITRYNRSTNYALAVHELARELRALVKPAN